MKSFTDIETCTLKNIALINGVMTKSGSNSISGLAITQIPY